MLKYLRRAILISEIYFGCTKNKILKAEPTAAKSLQLYLTLWDPIDGSPPGSAVPGILQARTLEWVAISFSNAWKWKVKVKSLSCVRPLATPWTAAHQAPPSMGFSRQEYWSGVPSPSPVGNIELGKFGWKDIKVQNGRCSWAGQDRTLSPENGKEAERARGRGGEGEALNKADFSHLVLLHKTRNRRIE